MPLLYKLHKIEREFEDGRTDPANNKWFARAIHLGVVDERDLAKQISYSTTVTEADCLAVINALSKQIIDNVQNSMKVKLKDLGTFKLGIKSTGADEANEFSVSENIVGTHVNFMPEYTIDEASGKRQCAMTMGCTIRETAKNKV